MNSRPPLGRAYAAVLVHASLSAGAYLAGRQVLRELDWAALGWLRMIAVTGIFWIAFLITRAPDEELLPPRELWSRLAAAAVLSGPVNQTLFLSGLARTKPAHGALLYSLTPVVVYALSVALGRERPALPKLAGLMVSLTGAVWLIAGRGGLSLDGETLHGDLLISGAVLAWSTFTVASAPLSARMGAIKTSAWLFAGSTLSFAPLGAPRLWAADLGAISHGAWLAFAYLVVLASAVCSVCWLFALRCLPPSRVAVFSNLQPVLTATLSWILFSEAPTWHWAAAGALVVTGVLITTQVRTRPTASPHILPEIPDAS